MTITNWENYSPRRGLPPHLSICTTSMQNICWVTASPITIEASVKIIDDEDIDLVITEAGFWGILPLLLRTGPRPPVLSCGTVAPMWHDPAFSVLTGPDDTPQSVP
jgi:hypothetical protein